MMTAWPLLWLLPAMAGTLCMAVMDGLQVQWLLDPKTDMNANFKVFGKLLHSALGQGAPGQAALGPATGDQPG